MNIEEIRTKMKVPNEFWRSFCVHCEKWKAAGLIIESEEWLSYIFICERCLGSKPKKLKNRVERLERKVEEILELL